MGKAITCLLVAVPLIIFNAWSSTEFVGDQMLGQIKAQEDNLTTKKQLSDSINAEKLRSKREAEERFLEAWVRTKDPAEKARIEKQLEKLRAETPELTAPMADPKAGARASWLSKRLGWDKETIEGITPTVDPGANRRGLFQSYGIRVVAGKIARRNGRKPATIASNRSATL